MLLLLLWQSAHLKQIAWQPGLLKTHEHCAVLSQLPEFTQPRSWHVFNT
jgi:hypothetical protein